MPPTVFVGQQCPPSPSKVADETSGLLEVPLGETPEITYFHLSSAVAGQGMRSLPAPLWSRMRDAKVPKHTRQNEPIASMGGWYGTPGPI